MNHLFRERAPITPAGWEEIEKEARRTLRALLAARRVVDFKGPERTHVLSLWIVPPRTTD